VRKDAVESYIRNDGQSKGLEAREIFDMIIKRDKTPDQKIDAKEFKDPEPNSKEILDKFEKEEMNFLEGSRIWNALPKQPIQNPHNNNMYLDTIEEDTTDQHFFKPSNDKKIFDVFIGGLPKGMSQEDFDIIVLDKEKNTYKSIVSNRMFKNKEGVCNGNAFVMFKDRKEAAEFIEAMNGQDLGEGTVQASFKR
jgi:RNA recognition motif-containing protein